MSSLPIEIHPYGSWTDIVISFETEVELKDSEGEFISGTVKVSHSTDAAEHCKVKNIKGWPAWGGKEGLDISDRCLDEMSSLLNDLLHRRSRSYDSSELIEHLLSKMDTDQRHEFVKNMVSEYL